MSYWKLSTGQWIYYSYKGEHFNFLRPHIIAGLFSYQKGWFLYTPIALIATLGYYSMWKANKKATPSLVLFFVLMLYVVFSWRGWWYGGSFSARAMIESLPILALPLAYLVHYVYNHARMLAVKYVFTLAMVFFIALNMFQSCQYSVGVIHYVLMSKAYYWKVFGK